MTNILTIVHLGTDKWPTKSHKGKYPTKYHGSVIVPVEKHRTNKQYARWINEYGTQSAGLSKAQYDTLNLNLRVQHIDEAITDDDRLVIMTDALAKVIKLYEEVRNYCHSSILPYPKTLNIDDVINEAAEERGYFI